MCSLAAFSKAWIPLLALAEEHEDDFNVEDFRSIYDAIEVLAPGAHCQT